MDELLHHCVREISFDGDLGCNASRLRDFVIDFYASHSDQAQNTDDAFCAFVWSLVVQQPTVRVGTIPEGITSEVWIAPQTSARRKASARGEELVETKPPELVLIPDASVRSLEHLQKEYGDSLRIAVDPQAIYTAITGSHIRFSKLSPMVYSALQLITRGRENGITVVELGQQSGYDQKTCFYLVKQLTELNLVVKVRRGGVGTHFCIHRYFFDRSPLWKEIREEESRARVKGATTDKVDDGNDANQDDEALEEMKSLNFTPIDARHLSSLPLVRGRVVKLLKASKNQMHATNNLLLILGFSHPTKTDRRFFNSRMRELIQQGIIERVVVPSNRQKSQPGATTICYRLLDENGSHHEKSEDVQVEDFDKGEEMPEHCGVRMNVTIHKQIIDLLEDAGTTGMTLTDLSNALAQFNRRTIELLLTRADKFPPPSHLSDLGIAGLMETSGRERRHRYFTVSAYRTLVAKENLDKSTAGYGDVNIANTGGFFQVDSGAFYDSREELHRYEDSFKGKEVTRTGKKVAKNPILPDGSIKQGRPRKNPYDEYGNVIPAYAKTQKSTKKRKRADEDPAGEAESAGPSKPKTKKRRPNPHTESGDEADQLLSSSDAPAPKRRGRALKARDPDEPPKKTGRPPKPKDPDAVKQTKRPAKAMDKSAPQGDDVSNAVKRPRKTKNADPDTRPKPIRRGRSSKAAFSASESNEHPENTGVSDIPESSEVPVSITRPTEDHEYPGMPALPVDSTSGVIDHLKPAQTVILEDTMTVDVPSHDRTPQFTSQIQSEATTVAPPVPSPSHDRVEIYQAGVSPSVTRINVQDLVSEKVHQESIGSIPNVINTISQPSTSGDKALEQNIAVDLETTTEKIQAVESEVQSTQIADTGKLPPPPTPVVTNKRSKTKVNVSHLRRENEFYRAVELMGGIVNTHTREFFDAHVQLIEELASQGEPTSAPVGTRTDKRTVMSTFNSLESRGRIMQVRASVPTPTGGIRSVVVVYLPDVSEERLREYLSDLGRSYVQPPQQPSALKRIEERVDYGTPGAAHQKIKAALPLQLLQMDKPGDDISERWSKNSARAEQLWAYDDSIIREVLLAERTTVSQMYGFIVAKALRTREIHLRAAEAFEHRTPSSNIVSYDDRILHLSYLYLDLPISQYLQFVAPLHHHEDLSQFLGTEEGKRTLAKDLPYNLHTMLQIGRSRARARVLELMEVLRTLKIAIPLTPSGSGSSWIRTEPLEGHPSAYDEASDGWNPSTPMLAPMYWKFTSIAPIYHWAFSESEPPFWKDMPVQSITDVVNYWEALKAASLEQQLSVGAISGQSTTGPLGVTNIGRSLRRSASWSSEYVLTWHQKQFLRRWVDFCNGRTPLDEDQEGSAPLEKLAFIISAPLETVKNYYSNIHRKAVKELEKARRRTKERRTAELAQETAEAKAMLMKKAAEARAHKEQSWDDLLERIHPEPLTDGASIRVKRVRGKFLQSSGQDLQKWEKQILDAIREAEVASRKVLKSSATRFGGKPLVMPLSAAPPPIASNPPETSITELIARQGPPLDSTVRKRKRSKVQVEGEDNDRTKVKAPVRRHRFQWNRDYDELARDASVVIRARCRNGTRLDWGAFEQVFPAVPRNTVRQRLVTLREDAANDAYLTRLEDQWYELWVQHRGSEALPDDDPESATNFNLIRHIEFLRNHIDKNAIRVGYIQNQTKPEVVLPSSLEALFTMFEVIEPTPGGPSYDFMWNATVEEGREKALLAHSFTMHSTTTLCVSETAPDMVAFAESALKMVLGTPSESYNPETGSKVLRSIGQEHVNIATKNLLDRGVLSKLVRDPRKQKPGRQLKISEPNQSALDGPVNRDLFQDAASLEELAGQDSAWREWPLLATDGDSATLVQLVSDNKVDFAVDTSQAQAARAALDWNSKKADDDDIETTIRVQFGLDLRPQSPQSDDSFPSGQQTDASSDTADHGHGHGETLDGMPACCAKAGKGIVDCSSCLAEQWTSLTSMLTSEENEVARLISETLVGAGEVGLVRNEIMSTFSVPPDILFSVIQQMTETPVPLLRWIGYTSVRLVSSSHIGRWTVYTSDTPTIKVLPRRWLDISGNRVEDVWEAALRAVVGTIVFKPGITQMELRWRLRAAYDRQEIGDILIFLCDEGVLKSRCDPAMHPSGQLDLGVLLALDAEEEKGVFWFLDDTSRHWYQL